MSPISNQSPLVNPFPPYSPYDIDVYAYQKPFLIVNTQQIEVKLQTPFDFIKTKEAKQAELRKKKEAKQTELRKRKEENKQNTNKKNLNRD